MGKFLICIAALIGLIVSGLSSAAAAEFYLRLGHGAAPDNPRHIVAKEFADAVKERTAGRVDIEIHHSESLGSDSQMAESLMLGKLDLAINSQGPVAAYIEKLNVLGLPFLFSSPEHAYTVLDGDIGAELAKPLERKNMKILAYWDNGFRHITNNRQPVTTSADMRDMRIRTPEDALTIAIFKALGAEPTPLAFSKLHEALKADLFDGQENPLTNIYFSKLYEVQKYLSLSSHKYECCPFIMSLRTWRMLPNDIRETIMDCAREFAIRHRAMVNGMDAELRDKLVQAGMVVNEVDTDEMRQRCAGVYADFEKVFGKELVSRIAVLAR
ncbi:MAG: TRAP transporter substrate-binding protein [Planctomycetes bacterium]|nr:TRAP transporter substrate-binding protein [Planctomycetota bacterium]